MKSIVDFLTQKIRLENYAKGIFTPYERVGTTPTAEMIYTP